MMSLYFIAVEPHGELIDKIRAIQKDFAERFSSCKSYKNFPHITITPPFSLHDEEETALISKFKDISLTTKPFTVHLNGFGSFSNSKNPAIFIKPENESGLTTLFNEINSAMKSFDYKVSKFRPHLTVAYRDLSPENYQKSWQEYQSKTFRDRFEVNVVKLYKHDRKKWNEIAYKPL